MKESLKLNREYYFEGIIRRYIANMISSALASIAALARFQEVSENLFRRGSFERNIGVMTGTIIMEKDLRVLG